MKDLLLITPPFTQLNTPYPATPYIKGFLNTKGISAFQMDLGIEVILALFSKENLESIFEMAYENDSISTENAERIYCLREEYLKTIEEVIPFLQGHSQTFAKQICTENFLPQASRFEQINDLEWAFGSMGDQDKAKYLATLYLEDLSDFIKECVDENFGFSRYAERLGRSANAFDELYDYLQGELTLIDEVSLDILEQRIQELAPKLICFSVPFPGNLYSAFRCAQYIKENYPNIKTAMGGGFANTELRSVKDKRVFEFFDFISLDDGELPLELLSQHVLAKQEKLELKRTFHLVENEVTYTNNSPKPDYKQAQVGTPDYSDLWLDSYISVIEIANPMHSLWSDGRWNKLTMAHGCYWGKCTFCDISLDYIKLYEPIAAKILVDRMEELIEQTDEKGFHFVDEAAPPALMRSLALEILKRKLVVTWWTNIRFEKNFTADLCKLLKASGCIAISGGLEVASDRLLALIDKGVTVKQVAQVTRNLTESGIMVHSYLMYGYPTQTVQETVDSLEMVRQMFELGILQSGFWHQFALTAHSPIGLNPEAFGIVPDLKEISFANNDVQFSDSTGIEHDKFSFGLKKSLFNYMHGICFEYPLQEWFEFKIPKTTVPKNLIADALDEQGDFLSKPNGKIVWLGTEPSVFQKNAKKLKFLFHTKTDAFEIDFGIANGNWLLTKLDDLKPESGKLITLQNLKDDYEKQYENFELFWYSKPIQVMRENGLLAL
ncbi:B12-binding domain-containing radical SAM protein [uncultured Arcticibacterium sp.]|uniref:B12-binding domain-containing radical SAM protein n=1 Tax=uncultured Arcticibacterium sp. TaxID=2173042 RepID=UPI0030FB8A24